MKNLPIYLLFLICNIHLSVAKTYFFLGNEDNLYENPANWSPNYPGTKVLAGDKLYIQSDVNFDGFNIEVEGLLDIEYGAGLYSTGNGIIIRKTGNVLNNGEINIRFIENFGTYENAYNTIIKKYYGYKYGLLNNSISALFTAKENFTNQGILHNYYNLSILGNLNNFGEIYMHNEANLTVSGNFVESITSEVKKSNNCKVIATKTLKHDTSIMVEKQSIRPQIKYAELLFASGQE
jgi:hypothetical protein